MRFLSLVHRRRRRHCPTAYQLIILNRNYKFFFYEGDNRHFFRIMLSVKLTSNDNDNIRLGNSFKRFGFLF